MAITTRQNDNDPTAVRGNAVDVKSTTNQMDAYGQKVMQVWRTIKFSFPPSNVSYKVLPSYACVYYIYR